MRWAGVGAAIIAAADDAYYLGVVSTQGGSNPQFLRVPFLAAGGAALAVVVLLASFSLTELTLRCPATGIESGSGAVLLGGPYQYRCDNGKLTVSR
jgi:hypothetical protein